MGLDVYTKKFRGLSGGLPDCTVKGILRGINLRREGIILTGGGVAGGFDFRVVWVLQVWAVLYDRRTGAISNDPGWTTVLRFALPKDELLCEVSGISGRLVSVIVRLNEGKSRCLGLGTLAGSSSLD